MSERQEGFTLVELIIVFAVLALMSATMVPLMHRSLGSKQLETGAWQLAGQVEYARTLARMTGRPHRVAWDEAAEHHWVEAWRPEERPAGFRPVAGVQGSPQALGRGVRLREVRPPEEGPAFVMPGGGVLAAPKEIVLEGLEEDRMTVAVPARLGVLVLTGDAHPFDPALRPDLDPVNLVSELPPWDAPQETK